MRERPAPILAVLLIGVLLGLTSFAVFGPDIDRSSPENRTAATGTSAAPTTVPPITTTTAASIRSAPTSTSTTLPSRAPGSVPGWTVGLPWGVTEGLTMFRGNPTRTFYGTGPVPAEPTEVWRYPESPMCSTSSAGGETTLWCGMGWTGQPVVYERPDGVTELIFGAYDRAVHFLDAETGLAIRPPFITGDLIKGSVTMDPDGHPLLYFGSRDNKLRIMALDRDAPEVLWSLDASEVNGIWNNDWDGNPVVVDDNLYVGGENGWFFAYRLNRSYGPDGRVGVDPVRLFAMPSYDDDLIARSGRNVSIESSVALFEQTVYFANSGGRVVGLDVSDVGQGVAPIVFDFYTGGDIDASPVVDSEGHLYVSIEYEPTQMDVAERERNRQIGQLVKLDPAAESDPFVWGLDLVSGTGDSGLWSTPALYEDTLYVNTHNGELIAVDADTGEIVWSDPVGFHSWSSPAVVDSTLVVATCTGELRAYSLERPRSPARLWSIRVSPACLEATPAIWNGTIYIGSRDGHIRAFR